MGKNSLFDDYDAFVEKFKPKKTTDDCYTPPHIYDAVLNWVRAEYNIPESAPILRPFKPGGDYQSEEYPDDCVVVDNPPFSILVKIISWYNARGVKFFLFAPALVLFNSGLRVNYVVANYSIIYDNGAAVNTSFVTNLGDVFINVAPSLYNAINAAADAAKTSNQLPIYDYPTSVISAARLNKIVARGISLQFNKNECAFIRKLDNQGSKKIFGGGFLLSRAAEKKHAEAIKAAEAAKIANIAKAAADKKEKAIIWELSEREKTLQKMLDNGAKAQE